MSCLKEDAVILDFFAGSGTTGQSVLELNKEDELDENVVYEEVYSDTDETNKEDSEIKS